MLLNVLKRIIFLYFDKMETLTRHCLACGKTVKGRIDKKFCDDYCRNVYNNRTKSDDNALIREVIQILKKNRRILAALIGEEGMLKIPRTKLLNSGFRFNYHTHIYTNQKGDNYYFCFEYGYLLIAGDWCLLVKRKEEKSPAS